MSWQKGPLPAGTYNWGGIVPAGTVGGFHFADFHGDHAKVMDDTGAFTKVVKAEDVEWFDNSLTLPPCCPHAKGSRLPVAALALLAVLLLGSWCSAADPAPKFAVESRLEPRFVVVDVRAAPAPASKPKANFCKECGLLCDCPVCDCESGVARRRVAEPGLVVTEFKLAEQPKAALPAGHSYPTISHAGRWWEWTGTAWKDVGPAPASTGGYDCSSGVCRPVSAPASYGAVSGAVPPFGGFGAGAVSGGCSGGNCSPAAGGFRRR